MIGVPLATSKLSGVDALYAMVQMPGGVPVACVAIDGAKVGDGRPGPVAKRLRALYLGNARSTAQ